MAEIKRIASSTLEALNRAALAVNSQLALDKTLQQIVDSARELAGARYAALGVPDVAGRLAEFIFSGITEQEANRIPHRPEGKGLLGALLNEGRSLRLHAVADDPRSVGFPPGHPEMKSFLGVPILAGGKVLGNLYLADKIGTDEFTEDDQSLVELLASHAASAVQNARLYQSTVDRNRELAALNAVAVATSQYLDLNRVMSEALDQVLTVSGAEAGEIFLMDETSGDMLLALHRGCFPDTFRTIRRFKRGEGFPGQVALSGKPMVTHDLTRDLRFLRKQVMEAGLQSFACIPLFAKGKVVGAIDLASYDPTAFDESDISLLMGIGHQIGVAVENARLYAQVARLAVLEERARIGMDLHDGVIQSIYAVGLTLEFTRMLLDEEPASARDRMGQSVAALNDVIRDIRSYILDLRLQRFDGDLSQGLARLAREFQANTLTPIDVHLGPQAIEGLNPVAAQALFHIAQEALANTAKHAKASAIRVDVARRDGLVTLKVEDNGQGFDPKARSERVGHGLANIRARAESLAGSLAIHAAPGQGTSLVVSIPVE
ncbi:MAG: GAF domain-containing sensor histidine kinase [Chloroflexi bacterium]|nr:GAF domain-containing sensor histidine kinase [Chloroflexota bacterium]